MYEYNAEIVKVYDGDSIRVNLDLGFGIFIQNTAIRLRGINTPEIRGESAPHGYAARDRLIAILASAENRCRVQTFKGKERGKYGRIIGEIYVGSDEKGWNHVNQQLLDEGYAVAYK